MTSVAAGTAGAARADATLLERALSALPLLLVFSWLALLHCLQAWAVPSPWLFGDELENAQLARSLAETGEPARREVTHPLTSLYVVLVAPAWLIGNAETAYETAKYIGAITMTLAVFPAYGLARLIAGPRASLFAAAASGAIPGFMYSGLLLQEPLAYPYATLALYVFARALAQPTFRWVVGAALLALIAPRVRGQLAVLPVVLLSAGLVVAAAGSYGHRVRERLSRWDRAGVVLLGIGLLIVANEYASHRSEPWQQTTRYWKHRMVELGFDAGGALAIGIGVLPVIAGLAILVTALVERHDRRLVAFATVCAASIAAFGFYTGLKAAWLSTIHGTLIVERNLIYLAPLFFAASAFWMSRGRLPVLGIAAATALVGTMIFTTRLELGYPYFEAPGFSILALANRELAWDLPTIRRALLVVLAVSALLLVSTRLLASRPRVFGALATVTALLVVSWNVTAQATASAGSRTQGEFLLGGYATPRDWVDLATGGRPAIYLGQQIQDPNQIHLLEFWNRSIRGMWSLDGSARGPGPTLTPDLAAATGELFPDPPHDYIVAEHGIDLVGTVIAERPGLRLYRIDRPLRLQDAVIGVYPDGWTGSTSAYSRYATPGDRPGTIVVGVSRLGCGNEDVAATARIAVGRLVVGPDSQPALGRVTAERSRPIRCKEQFELTLPTPQPPFRVEVTIDPTFVPADVDPGATDRRELGAQVAYRFVPGE